MVEFARNKYLSDSDTFDTHEGMATHDLRRYNEIKNLTGEILHPVR